MKKTYTDEELASLINEVETVFTSNLNKSETKTETKIEKSETKIEKEEIKNEKEEKPLTELYASMTKTEVEAHKTAIDSLFKKEEVKEEEEETKIEKSENDELTLIKSENEELKKNINLLVKTMSSKIIKKTPEQKAVNGVDYIAKGEGVNKSEEVKKDFSKLSKNEISSILTKKLKSEDISKSDKEAVMDYYSTGRELDKIKHLL